MRQKTSLARWCLAAAACFAAVPLAAQLPPPPEAAAGHTHEDVVRALYRQILERDPAEAEVQSWTPYLAAGYTARHLAHFFADSQEYRDRFITPYDSRTAVTLLYRHVLAREPDAPGRDHWAGIADAYGWSLVIQLLVWSEEYRLMFSDHGVPGRPVTVWDRRAALMLEPRTGNSVTERDLCLTVAAGAGAAYECGDLRLAHALPSVRVLGKTHAPVLLYDSEHQGERFPLLAARVMPGEWSGVLERVEVVLWLQVGDGWVERGRRSWQGADLAAWTPGQARRVAFRLPWAGPTGVYNYRVEAIFWAGGNVWGTDQLGQVAVVNRQDGPFGRGWWVAGLEQLVLLGNHLYWVGGDGSARLYQPWGGVPGTWVGAAVDRPDTIVATSTYPGAAYERRLPGGARIYFDQWGRHFATVNRLDQHTHFTYDGAGRLHRIWVPYQAGYYAPKLIYEFNYTDGRLTSVTAPDHYNQRARTLWVQGDPADPARVGDFIDPDGSRVHFEYDGAGRIAARVDKRGTRTVFGYDAGGKLSLAHVEMRGTGEDVVTRFTPAESRGLAPGDVVGQAVPVQDAFTLIDGPRGDVADHTRLWIDRWGGPWLVQDALGHASSLKRGDRRFPALVTETRAPNGLVTRAWYNARGMPDSVTVVNPLGDGWNATTRYAYGNAAWPDFATQITQPEGEVTRMDYDPATGSRVWQQPGTDPARRVSFAYYGPGSPHAGLPYSVTYPQGSGQTVAPVEAFHYDERGNLQKVVSPTGLESWSFADAFGRDTLVRSPIDNAQTRWLQKRLTYDTMDRVTVDSTWAPGVGSVPTMSVVVRTGYDLGGLPDSVSRRSVPDPNAIGWITTRFRYDALGRKVAELDPAWAADSTFYDPAGNVRATRDRRGHGVSVAYDALGRMVRRVPAGSSDVSRFTYDEMGNLLSATNDASRITRTYYPGGLLKTDSIKIRTSTPTPVDTLWTGYATHLYGLAYAYDLNGRRTRLAYPANLVSPSGIAGLRDHARYGYDPVTGALAWVEGLGADTRFEYRYDPAGRPESTSMPGGIAESYVYDLEGRLHWRHALAPAGGSWFTGGALRNDSLFYDARGKITSGRVTVIGPGGIGRGPQASTYDGIGNLVRAEHGLGSPFAIETLVVDALGNRRGGERFGENYVQDLSSYEARTGRLRLTLPVGDTTAVADTTSYWYDLAGNLTEVSERGKTVFNLDWYGLQNGEPEYFQRRVDSNSYYDAYGKLYDFRRNTNQDRSAGVRVREEYAYDALGRRVWRRAYNGWDVTTQTQRDTVCLRPFPSSECRSFVERTVWDGDQVLVEIRAPIDPSTFGVNQPESDYGGGMYPPDHTGRVAYVHAGGIDQPLEIVRMDVEVPFTVVPHADWRGRYDVVTFTGSRYAQCGPHVGYPLGTQPECFPFELPSMSAFGELKPRSPDNTDPGPRSWLGSLIVGSRDASGLLYRRNRYLDPKSGRFTQEDPIGLAGGLNAYGFAAGDPVSYSDPYGLIICAKTPGLRRGLERTVNGTIAWDNQGCVRNLNQVRFQGGERWRGIQTVFAAMVTSSVEFTLAWRTASNPCVESFWGSQFQPRCMTAFIDQRELNGNSWYWGDYGQCRFLRADRSEYQSLEGLIAHELLGHGSGIVGPTGAAHNEGGALEVENLYHRASGRRLRCRG